MKQLNIKKTKLKNLQNILLKFPSYLYMLQQIYYILVFFFFLKKSNQPFSLTFSVNFIHSFKNTHQKFQVDILVGFL